MYLQRYLVPFLKGNSFQNTDNKVPVPWYLGIGTLKGFKNIGASYGPEYRRLSIFTGTVGIHTNVVPYRYYSR